MRLKDMKIGTKLTGSFVIILLLMTAIGIFCIKSIRDIETANGEIQDITLAELNLARGRQDSLRLIYTGEEQYGEAARFYLTAARGWVGKMLERNGAARIYSGEAEENGRELDRALADYLDALVVIEGTNGAMKESSRAGEAAARQVDLVFSGLESFVVEVTDGAYTRGEDELGRLLLTQNLVHIYDMTGLWDRTAGIMGAYEKNATVENRDALLSHLEEIVARFDRADVIFTTEEGRRAIRDVRVPFGVYRSQAQAFIDASEAQTAAISRAVDAGAATAASADRASQVLQAIVGETTEKAVRYTLILSLAALVISLVLALVITRRITGPILRSMAYAQSLSEGDFSVTLGLDQADEVGTLGAALEDMVDRVRRVLHHIQNSSRQVTGASGQISQSAQTISVGASEQASSMEEVSSSLEELSSNIQQNAANAQRSNEAADLIKRDTSHGVEAVRETVRAMKDIGEKIGVIEDLARNTNMLALNAAIEAARAGEAGKGFAVVASEVRKLAENSGNAAKVITEITRENVKKAESALEKIEAVIPVIGQSAELSDEIALGSEEQAKGAEQINSAVSALDQVVQQNASASEELASMAEELEAQARSMNEAVSFFRLGEERRAAREDRVEIGTLPGESPASERRKLLSDGTDGDFEEF